MNYKTSFLLAFGLLFSFYIKAQIVLVPLQSNVVLESHVKSTDFNAFKNKSNDTLSLPFFDDFANTTVYPDNSKWIDNDVFVNQAIGDNPPSIGVATFDALDYSGLLQSNASTSGFISDYLTSKPINLLNYTDINPISVSTDTLFYYESATGIYWPADSLWYETGGTPHNCLQEPTTFTIGLSIYYQTVSFLNDVTDSLYTYNTISGQYEHIVETFDFTYSPADSLYLSFLYQPQGLAGNSPESSDSLVLEFMVPGSNWKHIWAKSGSANKAFDQVMIPIVDSIYFVKGFQFRFKNYASIGVTFPPTEASFAGNCDIWNLDYILLSKERNEHDTIPDDVTFVVNQYSFLKDYSSVPWNHYKSITGFQNDSIKFFYRNLGDTLINVSRQYKVTNKTTGSLIFNRSLGNENIAPFADFNFSRRDTSKYFPQTSGDHATFEVQISQTSSTLSINEPYKWNDTLKYYQKFSNYYAYDDGIPEMGFGIAGQGSEHSQLAFKFYPLKPDTLRGIYMFFNRVYNNANQKYFYITIWSASNGKPNSIIYQQEESVRPEFNGFNEFHYYNLDTAILITDTFFIGWTQTDDVLLNIGFDVNYDASSKVFYKMDSFSPWNKNPYQGTPMMRPVFSSQPFVSIKEPEIVSKVHVNPNPASDILYIDAPDNFNFKLYSITGSCVSEIDQKSISVANLEPGFYILKGTDGKSTFSQKIIINR